MIDAAERGDGIVDQDGVEQTFEDRRHGPLEAARHLQFLAHHAAREDLHRASQDLLDSLGEPGPLALHLAQGRKPLAQCRLASLQLLRAPLQDEHPLIGPALGVGETLALPLALLPREPGTLRAPIEIGDEAGQALALQARRGRLPLDALERGRRGARLLREDGAGAADPRLLVEQAEQPGPPLRQERLALLDGALALLPERFDPAQDLAGRHRDPGVEDGETLLLLGRPGLERLDGAAGLLDPPGQLARLILSRAEAGLRPIDRDVEGVNLLAPRPGRRLPLLQPDPQGLEIGVDARQSRGRLRRAIAEHGECLGHGAPLGIERQEPPTRDREPSFPERLHEPPVAPRLRRLAPQRVDLLLHLGGDVGEAQQVRLRRLQLLLGLPPLGLEAEDAGRLLDDGAAVLRLGGQDLLDLPLLDGGVETGADLLVAQPMHQKAQHLDLALAQPAWSRRT